MWTKTTWRLISKSCCPHASALSGAPDTRSPTPADRRPGLPGRSWSSFRPSQRIEPGQSMGASRFPVWRLGGAQFGIHLVHSLPLRLKARLSVAIRGAEMAYPSQFLITVTPTLVEIRTAVPRGYRSESPAGCSTVFPKVPPATPTPAAWEPDGQICPFSLWGSESCFGLVTQS